MSQPPQPTLFQKSVALLSLAAVSTAIGVTMKLSQTGGKYEFHPASCVVFTELFKLISSVVIAVHVLRSQQQEERTTFSATLQNFWKVNFTNAVIKHEFGLAVAYCAVNLVTYPIFVHASASVFFLLKAASPVVTAVMLRVLVKRSVSGVQWFAILAQCVGLLVTQYNPCGGGTAVSAVGYGLIVVNVVVSCLAGVWNEHIIKNHGTSVNAQNIILYSWGAFINLFAFLAVPHQAFGLASPVGFFEGYTWSALGVVIASGSVGLVITAVYKYADVVIKTFGLAGSTIFLFLLEASGVLPVKLTPIPIFVLFLGGLVVFYAAYLYMSPAPSAAASLAASSADPTKQLPPAEAAVDERTHEQQKSSSSSSCPAAFLLLLFAPCHFAAAPSKSLWSDRRVILLGALTASAAISSVAFADCSKFVTSLLDS